MFLVCGEILYDIFVNDEAGSSVRLDARPGGSPFNVAVGLARLDQTVSFAGTISTDLLGDRLAASLSKEKINTDFLVRKPLPTTLSFIALDRERNAEYAFYGTGAADRDFLPFDLPSISDSIRVIHFGSFSTMVTPIAATIEAMLAAEVGRRLISYDPNVRFNVEPDRAAWRAKIDAISRRVHLLKISTDDLKQVYPDVGAADAAATFLENGVRLVIVTMGQGGAAAWTKQTHASCAAVKIAVCDTVGAGDSFQAALLASLAERGKTSPDDLVSIQEADLGDMLTFATHAAALTCGRLGADPPRRLEIDCS